MLKQAVEQLSTTYSGTMLLQPIFAVSAFEIAAHGGQQTHTSWEAPAGTGESRGQP